MPKPITILLATRNKHKVKELHRLIPSSRVRFVPMDAVGQLKSAVEDGSTFRENAGKKALFVSRQTELPVIAEDSGIEVSALGGRPGVLSARFAGPAQDDAANNRKMLKALAAVPGSKRQARYVCCMALAVEGKIVRFFEGVCRGTIAFARAGNTGFGYDPLFIPAGYRRTMAQLGPRIKSRISHRSKAAAKLKVWLMKRGAGPDRVSRSP